MFGDLERQKHHSILENYSCKHTNDLHTGKHCHGLFFVCFVLSHALPDAKQGWPLLCGIYVAVAHTVASVGSSKQYHVFSLSPPGLILWCVDLLPVPGESRRLSSDCSLVKEAVLGNKRERDWETVKGGGRAWERCCSRVHAGLLGWQAVSAVFFSVGDREKGRGEKCMCDLLQRTQWHWWFHNIPDFWEYDNSTD